MRNIGLFICLSLLGGAGLCAQNAEGGFETDGNGTITKYTGGDEAVVIPPALAASRSSPLAAGPLRKAI
jgi:hypothetical protein